jgi:hypothetical protein
MRHSLPDPTRQHDWRVLQLGKRGDNLEAVGNGAQLIADAHAHVAFDDTRRPLRVEGNEIQR